MDLTQLICRHNYLRWEGEQLTCAVCSKPMEGEFVSSFTGTFPRDEYEAYFEKQRLPQTMTIDTTKFSHVDYLDFLEGN